MSRPLTIAIASMLLLSSCSHDKVSPDEISSDLTSAVSLASEAQTFIDFVGQNRATDNYKKAQIRYLSEEAAKLATELHQAKTSSGPEDQLEECRKELDALVLELDRVAQDIDTPEALASHKQRLAVAQKALQQLRASL